VTHVIQFENNSVSSSFRELSVLSIGSHRWSSKEFHRQF